MSRKNLEIQINNQVYFLKAEAIGQDIWLHFKGRHFVLTKKQPVHSDAHSEEQKIENVNFISSPMPGKIVKIEVKEGEKVKEDQSLLVLASMKMEYTLKAPREAVIKKIKIKEGTNVSAGEELMLFEKES